MTDITIRHSEMHDIDAIRQIVAHPAVYLNTLQYPYPSHGMRVDALHHGRGVGTRLLAAAIALYEKHGFRIEGEAPDYALRDGVYASAYQMARVKQRR
ncbi:GNAT family N-acetyltransferase [Burkholderia anthina]|uniref:GNAT family N-acetyltransferase n=1 Tax=Burkholderia anthina TaxID=179879 RepID=UPI00158DF7E3|nr:GNAT family N-acetyltransferase [Burkholderia anthina]